MFYLSMNKKDYKVIAAAFVLFCVVVVCTYVTAYKEEYSGGISEGLDIAYILERSNYLKTDAVVKAKFDKLRPESRMAVLQVIINDKIKSIAEKSTDKTTKDALTSVVKE